MTITTLRQLLRCLVGVGQRAFQVCQTSLKLSITLGYNNCDFLFKAVFSTGPDFILCVSSTPTDIKSLNCILGFYALGLGCGLPIVASFDFLPYPSVLFLAAALFPDRLVSKALGVSRNLTVLPLILPRELIVSD
jgi:hypothetical protein